MFRILVFLSLIAAAAVGLGYLIEQPGSLTLSWFGLHIETSPLVGLGAVAISAILLFGLARLILRLPGLTSSAFSARRRRRGREAISQGILAAGVGDLHKARRASLIAKKLAAHEPLTLLLEAQTAQLAGDREAAERAFRAMAEKADTRLFGLRGLHAESLRAGDLDKAHAYATQAQAMHPLGWSGQALLERHASLGDWDAARLAVAQNLKAKLIEPAVADRQRAVLDLALAMECELTEPDRALTLAKAAVKKAPELVPASAMLARLYIRKNKLRAAAKVLEAAFARTPHPELAELYVDLRHGDSASDRFLRAKKLETLAPGHVESAFAVAKAALAADDFFAARNALAPLVAEGQRPSARICLLMAELEEREHKALDLSRQWLARAARAPRDAIWIADGHWSRQWAPISPVTGQLDAFRFEPPKEELLGPAEPPPPAYVPPQIDAECSEPEPIEVDSRPVASDAPPEAHKTEAPKTEAGEAKAEPAPIRGKISPEPVIFPLATPPDDPGPRKDQPETRLF